MQLKMKNNDGVVEIFQDGYNIVERSLYCDKPAEVLAFALEQGVKALSVEHQDEIAMVYSLIEKLKEQSNE